MSHQPLDLASIIQTSLNDKNNANENIAKLIGTQSTSEIIINKPKQQQITVPVVNNHNNTIMPQTTQSLQLPSSSSIVKEQSLVIPNFNPNGGPLLCQLDDNSYVLIEGLDQLGCSVSPTKTTGNSSVTTTTATQLISTQQIGAPLSVAMKPISTIGTAPTQTKVMPSINTSAKTSVKVTAPLINSTVKGPTTITNPSSSSRPALFVVKNSPVTSKPNVLSQPVISTISKPTVKPPNICSTSPTKTFANLISAGGSTTTPLKYILIPNTKPPSKTNQTGQTTNIPVTSGVKTITFNPLPSSNFNLPAGTTLIPTKSTDQPMPATISAPTITPSKLNFVVPASNQFTTKIQSPLYVTTSSLGSNLVKKAKEDAALKDCSTKSPAQVSVLALPMNSETPKNADVTAKNSSEAGPMKTLITYSKQSPKLTITTPPNKIMSAFSSNGNALSRVSLDNEDPFKPSNVPAAQMTGKQSTIIGSNKRKTYTNYSCDNSLISPKRFAGQRSSDGTATRVVRKVIASRNLQTPDKNIINTAVQEFRKLFARRELLLKQLNSSCVSLGKVDYKLTISGSPINIQGMYARIETFQKEFEEDLKRLDWAVSAMHKLYTELAPKDEMRTIEEILKDLMGSTQGLSEDSKSKFNKIKSSPTKPASRSRPKIKIPQKSPKKFYYPGEEGCPKPVLEERVVPDKDPTDGKYHCELCFKVFLKQISLAKHLEFDHPVSLGLEKKLSVAKSRSRSPKRAHSCTDCDKSFHSNVMLLIHRSNTHEGTDSYELSRESRTYSRRSMSEFKDAMRDEQEVSPPTVSEKVYKPGPRRFRGSTARKRSKTLINNIKREKNYDSDYICQPEIERSRSSSRESSFRSNWHEADIFDPDIPIECTAENPIILLKPLSKEVIAAYTKRKI